MMGVMDSNLWIKSCKLFCFPKSVTQDHLDEKPSTWAPCLLHILRQLCYLTPILPLRYVEILPEIGRSVVLLYRFCIQLYLLFSN